MAHAWVTAYLRYSAMGSRAPVLAGTETKADGSYAIANLTPGSYLICAQVEGEPLLNPCDWLDKPPAWNLRAGETGRVDIAMPRGTYLHVRVRDADGELAKVRGNKGPEPYEFALITRRQSMQQAVVVANDKGGENLRVAVPANAAVDYVIGSSGLALLDSAGKEMGRAGGGAQRQKLTIGSGEKVIVVTTKKR